MTVYDWNLHDLGKSAFQSIQKRALLEQSLRDATPSVEVTKGPVVDEQASGGVLRKLAVGAALVGAVGGVLYIGSRLLPDRRS